MSYYGENLQRGVGLNGLYLRDFTHAAKIFRAGSYDLVPKFKFLFHTYFDINPVAYGGTNDYGNNFGILVKSVKLPTFSIKTQELNQYNRKRLIQTKINYDAINITFHDDNVNTVTKLWDAYYSYYYKDPTNFNGLVVGNATSNQYTQDVFNEGEGSSNAGSYDKRNIYSGDIAGNNNWGYIGESVEGTATKASFFRNITVFGFNRHNFTSYTLINPLISKLDHDTYNYNEGGGTMEIKMDIQYETVVYNEGAMDGQNPDNIVAGFGLDQFYDKDPSPITPVEARSAITGRGKLVDAAGGYIRKLNAEERKARYTVKIVDQLNLG